MASDTNFHNMKALLEEYEPETYGIASEREVRLITDKLELEGMSVLELRNLRDFAVLYFSQLKGGDGNTDGPDKDAKSIMDVMDKMSAVTSVIDGCIVKLGGEV